MHELRTFLDSPQSRISSLHNYNVNRYARYRHVSFFFFQAEDGIRDLTVTGVQTCALPISWPRRSDARPLQSVAPSPPGWHCSSQSPGGLLTIPIAPPMTPFRWSSLWSLRQIGRASCRERV